MTKPTIGERIKTLREEQGLSQRDVEGPGCTAAYVSRLERGQRDPSVKVLRHLASKLGTTAEWLETGKHAVVTLMLEDYEEFLGEYGLKGSKLSHEEIERLGRFTREAIKDDKYAHPLRSAVAILKTDNELREQT